jgi:acylphosphatase
MADVRARVLVAGRVQGVGFRYATRDAALAAGVRGWVRNRSDGRVEAVFEGPEEAVRQMIAWCRQGPPGAFVRAVEVSWETPIGEPDDFRIERTAFGP